MVNISLIRKSNSQIDKSSAPRIAVFVGGTSGIGKITLNEIAGLGVDFKAYVVGRKASEESFRSFAEELHQSQPNADIIWVEGEVSLLAEVKRVCDRVKALESRIDLLFMTTGYAPWEGRKGTAFLWNYCRELTCFRHLGGLGPQSRAILVFPRLLRRESSSPSPSIRKRAGYQRSRSWTRSRKAPQC